jgi:protein involved in sex pheromone biosynthesis
MKKAAGALALAVAATVVALAGCGGPSQADALEEVKRTEEKQKQAIEDAKKSGRGGAIPMFDLDR